MNLNGLVAEYFGYDVMVSVKRELSEIFIKHDCFKIIRMNRKHLCTLSYPRENKNGQFGLDSEVLWFIVSFEREKIIIYINSKECEKE